MKVAVIDSGINKEFCDFKHIAIEAGDFVPIGDENGHGTASAAEIVNVNPNVELLVFKCLGENNVGKLSYVVDALKSCLQRQDVSIINMSISTWIEDDEIFKYLENLVKRIIRKKMKVVASISNNITGKEKARMFPGDIPGVIRIRHIYASYNHLIFCEEENTWLFYGPYHLMPTKQNTYAFYKGNSSFAARYSGLLSITDKMDEMNRLLNAMEEEKAAYLPKEEAKKVIQYICGGRQLDRDWETSEYIRLLKTLEMENGIELDYKKFSIETFKSVESLLEKISE